MSAADEKATTRLAANGRMAIGAAAVRQALRSIVNLSNDLSAVSAMSVKGGIVLGGMARVPVAQVIAPAPTPTIAMSGTINVDGPSGNTGRIELIAAGGNTTATGSATRVRSLYHTAGEAAEALGVGVSTLYAYVSRKCL